MEELFYYTFCVDYEKGQRKNEAAWNRSITIEDLLHAPPLEETKNDEAESVSTCLLFCPCNKINLRDANSTDE